MNKIDIFGTLVIGILIIVCIYKYLDNYNSTYDYI